MKKVVSLIAAAAMFAAVSGAAIAADNNPAVYVNNAKIFFDDQEATIVDDRTLVPARGVFEAMGAKVDWDGEARVVTIETGDGTTAIKLTIDNDNMVVYDIMSMFANALSSGGASAKADQKTIELDVAPQIINDRTMIPLRAISEAMDATVEWNGEAYCVDIRTKDAPTEEKKETMPTYFLTTSADTVAEGETVDVYVNIKNTPSDVYVSNVEAVVSYDKDNFEFVSSAMINGDAEIDGVTGIDNPDFNDNFVKAVYVNINKDTAVTSDGRVLKLTFKSINGKDGVFALSDSYNSVNGYNVKFGTTSLTEAENVNKYFGNTLNIDTTPVIVNAADAEATAEPEATTVPEATEAPEATTEPKATTAPEATAEPKAAPEA